MVAIPKEKRERIRRLLEEGIEIGVIAEKTLVDTESIEKCIYGTLRLKNLGQTRLTPQQKAQIEEGIGQGLSNMEIAIRYNLPKNSVRHLRKGKKPRQTRAEPEKQHSGGNGHESMTSNTIPRSYEHKAARHYQVDDAMITGGRDPIAQETGHLNTYGKIRELHTSLRDSLNLWNNNQYESILTIHERKVSESDTLKGQAWCILYRLANSLEQTIKDYEGLMSNTNMRLPDFIREHNSEILQSQHAGLEVMKATSSYVLDKIMKKIELGN